MPPVIRGGNCQVLLLRSLSGDLMENFQDGKEKKRKVGSDLEDANIPWVLR